MRIFKVIKTFRYYINDVERTLYENTMIVETTENVVTFNREKVGDTQELIDNGFIREVNVDRSYW